MGQPRRAQLETPVFSLALSTDGRYLAAQTALADIAVFNPGTLEPIARIAKGNANRFAQSLFVSDRPWIVTAADRNATRLPRSTAVNGFFQWHDAETGLPLTRRVTQPGAVQALRVVSDPRAVCLATAGGSVQFHPLVPNWQPLEPLSDLIELRAAQKFDSRNLAIPLTPREIVERYERVRKVSAGGRGSGT